MRPEDYPPQEPLSEVAQRYHDELLRRGAETAGEEVQLGDDPYQSLVLHVPERPNGTVLAFIHGGGWTAGYKEWMNFMAPAFTARGVLFASVGYRLAPTHSFPTGVEDVAHALGWLFRNVATYQGDPARLFIGGHSAGGHYASLLAVRRDWQAGEGLPATVVRGCLPISGVYDFTRSGGLTMRPRFLGSASTEHRASPIHTIDGVPPPFLIAHGDRDFPHLMGQAARMEQALHDAGGTVERIVMPDRDHFSASYAGGEPDGPWVPKALDFMAAH